jgi:tetratricopeptide (TPR) repeat protein
MDPILPIIAGLILISAVALVFIKKRFAENSDFWFSMGMILADFGKYERAARCCERAVRIYPFYVHAWNNWGLALLKLGRHEEALERLDEALTLNPALGEGWYNKGIILEKLHREGEAEEAFERARSLGVSP